MSPRRNAVNEEVGTVVMDTKTLDGAFFRRVLGNFPTGVVAVTALDDSGNPVGMAVGSFTSVSLDPPLVAFLPMTTSTTWPKIERAGRFAISFLAEDQEDVTRALSMRSDDKFKDLDWHLGEHGSPLLEGAVGWIECELETVHEAGDHFIVLGRVLSLETPNQGLPLLFFRGGYGKFLPLSFSAWASDLRSTMQLADISRPHLESVRAQTGALECCATAVVGDSLVVIAAASSAELSRRVLASRIGLRMPFHPPLGGLFVATLGDARLRNDWLKSASERGEDYIARLEASLDASKKRGYDVRAGDDWQRQLRNVELASEEPGGAVALRLKQLEVINGLRADYESVEEPGSDQRTVNVPVVISGGDVPLVLTVITDKGETAIPEIVRALKQAAKQIAEEISNSQECKRDDIDHG